jgi:Amt family ammonium transporter
MLLFMAAWSLIVYSPVAHSVWALDGFLRLAGILDFAGGTVVHISSGFSALVAAIVLGKRHGHGNARFEPHNVSISLIGASLLWVGWFGFNAGSAISAGKYAGLALSTTQVATGAAGMSWMLTEWAIKGKPTVMSVISGAVAGLVAITPACGYVDHNGAIIMGFAVGIVCSQSIRIKHYFGFDDALDAFGVHGVGGVIGGLLTGLFASPKLNNFYPGCPIKGEPCPGPGSQRISGAFYDWTLPKNFVDSNGSALTNRHGLQLGLQFYGIVVVAGWSSFCTYVILKILDKIVGLRVDIKDEVEGLDASVHGETVYYGSEDMKPPEDSVHGAVEHA